jgi:Cu(I)/Ag(I) efflux system periplasmic protein CusF
MTPTEVHMKAKHTFAVAAIFVAAAVGAQQGSQERDHASHHPAASASALQSEGEVRKVDLAQRKVTLRHGPLANLDMPAMTMVFTAPDPKMIEGLKQGDKVRFTADRKDGSFIVTAIEAIK